MAQPNKKKVPTFADEPISSEQGPWAPDYVPPPPTPPVPPPVEVVTPAATYTPVQPQATIVALPVHAPSPVVAPPVHAPSPEQAWLNREIERRAQARMAGPQGLDYVGRVIGNLNPFGTEESTHGEPEDVARVNARNEVESESKTGTLHATPELNAEFVHDDLPPSIAQAQQQAQRHVDLATTVGMQAHTPEPPVRGGESAPAPQATFVPAHSAPLVSPRIRSAYELGEQLQFEGADHQSEAEQDASNELASWKQNVAEEQRVNQLIDQKYLDDKRQGLEDHLAQLQAKADALATKRVDPKDYEKHLGVGQQIIGALSMALGGFVQGFRGGPNAAADIVSREIDRNIDAQKTNLEAARNGTQTDMSLYGQKLRLLGDEDAARRAARQDMLASSQLAGDAIAEKYKSPIVDARWAQVKGELARQFAHEQAGLEKWQNDAYVGGSPGGPVDDTASDIKGEMVFNYHGLPIAIQNKELRDTAHKSTMTAEILRGIKPSLDKLWRETFIDRALSPVQFNNKYMSLVTAAAMQASVVDGRAAERLMRDVRKSIDPKLGILTPGAKEAFDNILREKEIESQKAVQAGDATFVREVQRPSLEKGKNGVLETRYQKLGKVGEADPEDAVPVTVTRPDGSIQQPTGQPPPRVGPPPVLSRAQSAGGGGSGKGGRGGVGSSKVESGTLEGKVIGLNK